MTRHRNRLPARLLAYFEANDGEELDFPAICTKFDVTRRCAEWAVYTLCAEGKLENVRVIRSIRKVTP